MTRNFPSGSLRKPTLSLESDLRKRSVSSVNSRIVPGISGWLTAVS